jgi:hypothetical protein
MPAQAIASDGSTPSPSRGGSGLDMILGDAPICVRSCGEYASLRTAPRIVRFGPDLEAAWQYPYEAEGVW